MKKAFFLPLVAVVSIAAYASPSDTWEVFCKYRGSHHGSGSYSYDGAREYCKRHEANGHQCMYTKE